MTTLRERLVKTLKAIPGVELRDAPVAGGMALFHRGKAFGHFHSDDEIDLRLGRQLIEAEGLLPLPDSTRHPKRSAGSPWIELRIADADDVAQVARLVALAVGNNGKRR